MVGPEVTELIAEAALAIEMGATSEDIALTFVDFAAADGRYAPEGYAAALAILAVLQLATLAWLLPMRQPSDQPRL